MGETVVYVPITCASGPVGVMEIHGLYSAGITNTSSFERPQAPLKAMIAAKDFKCVYIDACIYLFMFISCFNICVGSVMYCDCGGFPVSALVA